MYMYRQFANIYYIYLKAIPSAICSSPRDHTGLTIKLYTSACCLTWLLGIYVVIHELILPFEFKRLFGAVWLLGASLVRVRHFPYGDAWRAWRHQVGAKLWFGHGSQPFYVILEIRSHFYHSYVYLHVWHAYDATYRCLNLSFARTSKHPTHAIMSLLFSHWSWNWGHLACHYISFCPRIMAHVTFHQNSTIDRRKRSTLNITGSRSSAHNVSNILCCCVHL